VFLCEKHWGTHTAPMHLAPNTCSLVWFRV